MEQIVSPSPIKSNRISPVFLFIVLGITTTLLTAIIINWTSVFMSVDQPVPIQYITAKKIAGRDPIPVQVSLRINNFETFDMNNDKFIFDGVLSFEFDPSLISLNTLEQISFNNGKILSISAPTTQMIGDKLFARYSIKVQFTNYISYKMFPMDDHRISIILVQKNVSPDEIIFISNNANFVVGQDMNFAGWNNSGQNVETGYLEEGLDQYDKNKNLSYPAAVFSIDYGRKANIRNTLTIIFPMLALFFIALFSLTLDRDKELNLILSTSTQSIVGLVAFRFVMESLSPKVGYFLYADYFFFLFLFLMFCVLLINMIGDHLNIWGRKILIILLNAIIVLFFLYLLWPQ